MLDGRLPTRSHSALLDVTVRRNAYGRQRELFETPLAVDGLTGWPVPGRVHPGVRSSSRPVPRVDVLASHDDHPVLVRSGCDLGRDVRP